MYCNSSLSLLTYFFNHFLQTLNILKVGEKNIGVFKWWNKDSSFGVIALNLLCFIFGIYSLLLSFISLSIVIGLQAVSCS